MRKGDDLQMVQMSITIVTYNRKQMLEQCLNSIFSQKQHCSYEVIVVDNCSVDGTADVVRAKFPSVTLISNSQNLGFAKANNQGIQHSRGPFVLLLNDDTIVLPGALKSMVTFALSHPEVGALGCQLRNPNGTIQPSCGEFPTLLKIALQVVTRVKIKRMMVWGYDAIREVDWVTGACMLIPRGVIEKVGMLDEDYFMYHEDADWCYRVRQAGFKAYFIPDAQMIHYKGKHWEVWDPRILIENRKSLLTFYRKHYGTFALLRLKIFTIPAFAVEWLYATFLLVCHLGVPEMARRRAKGAREAILMTLRF